MNKSGGNNIKIYKASAGTGKTHKLTYEYISLLFKSQEKHPHRSILAVTFTNKATNEMKERIVDELNNLANYSALDPQKQEKSYMKDLCNELNRAEKDIEATARAFVNDILNDYTNFNVSTNDAFFQRILRSFARELGLPSDYALELDEDLILEQAVESLLFELKQQDELYTWLANYVQDLLNDEVGWNVENKLTSKAQSIIFTESFKQISETLSQTLGDDKFTKLGQYQKTLNEILTKFEANVQTICDSAQQIMKANNLVFSDFSGGSMSFAHYFEYDYLKSKNFKTSDKFVDNSTAPAENWCAKSNVSKLADITSAYNAGLCDCARKIVSLDTKDYFSAIAILDNLHFLGVIAEIVDRINKLCGDQNKQLLDNANEFLHRIIGECDTPFIYEKSGVNIHHFLLDEFQDTSELQWQNFKPLLANSLSNAHENLIVGDAKQSIYRWRNSNWHILQERIESDFPGQCTPDSLNENWRSAKNIINFNNMFFDFVQHNLGDDFATLYDENYQFYPQKKKEKENKTGEKVNDGCVKVDLISSTDFKSEAIKRTHQAIIELHEKNYPYKDITILVRTGNEAAIVANYLIKLDVPVVSEAALKLLSSPAVRLLVATLRYLAHPEEKINRGQIEFLWHAIGSSKVVANPLTEESFEEWEKRVFGENKLYKLRYQPLVKLLEEIIWLYNIPEKCSGELTYVLAFQDLVFSFAENQQADLLGFLDYWDKNGTKKSLSNSDTLDAVRIMTIHKAKGLASEAIIVPFCDETLVDNSGNKQPTLWCKTDNMPTDFQGISIVPIKGKMQTKTDYFKAAFESEDLQRKIETINLYYVAFTRAKKYMYIIADKNDKETPTKENLKKISNCLQLAFQDETMSVNCCKDNKPIKLSDFYNNDADYLQIGELEPISAPQTNTSTACELNYYMSREMPKLYERYTDENTRKGIVLHSIFGQIKTKKDVATIVQKSVDAGEVAGNEQQSTIDYVNKLIAFNEQTADWFSGKYEVKNELSILVNGKKQRPDRVMISGDRAIVVDYKFGDNKSDSYPKQVRNYMRLLTEMGYTTEGYLWYTKLGEIELVE